jgi:hypothetical protein
MNWKDKLTSTIKTETEPVSRSTDRSLVVPHHRDPRLTVPSESEQVPNGHSIDQDLIPCHTRNHRPYPYRKRIKNHNQNEIKTDQSNQPVKQSSNLPGLTKRTSRTRQDHGGLPIRRHRIPQRRLISGRYILPLHLGDPFWTFLFPRSRK